MRVLLGLFIMFLGGCSSSGFKLQQGDLLFQDLDCGPTCEAIESVTHGIENTNMSHMGVVLIEENIPYVLEAVPPRVVKTPLDSFLTRSVDDQSNPKVWVGRIYSRDIKFIGRALRHAKQLIGRPYDEYYMMHNGQYYCSEMVYEMYKRANYNRDFFSLAPMTFKLKNDTAFHPAWIEYYDKIHSPIPEGKPGCNPALISTSEHLKIVHKYGALSKK